MELASCHISGAQNFMWLYSCEKFVHPCSRRSLAVLHVIGLFQLFIHYDIYNATISPLNTYLGRKFET